jgi:hypothetical protein
MTDTDLLPDRLKYFWADDEEGPYQGPFSSRELATSDAYTYRAKCFDDPSQDDGFFMMATHGLLVDAEDGPWRVLAIDVTDQFHDAWNTRASTPSSTRANERGDDSLQAQIAYSAYLQQIIEALCHGHPIPEPKGTAVHHYEMAVAYRKTPQPSPQSEMVAVPREVITDLQGTLNYIAVQGKANHPGFAQVARMNAEDAVKRLQPYTKGE